MALAPSNIFTATKGVTTPTTALPNDIQAVLGEATDAQRAIQFVRSTPGLGTALVGMKQTAHVQENLAVSRSAPLDPEQFAKLFK